MVRIRAFATLACCVLWTLGTAQGFLVEPYLQPGDASGLDREERVVLWEADTTPTAYSVEFAPERGRSKGAVARPNPTPWGTLLYEAPLKGLAFDTSYTYTIRRNGQQAFEGTFRTRPRGDTLRFAVVGDTGNASSGQALTALGIWRTQPSLIVHTGDYVYTNGRGTEYRKNLFPIYNAPAPNASTGAPLLRSIPVYVAFGNHDFNGIDLDAFPDGLAAFIYNRLPLNGPRLANAPQPRGNAVGFLASAAPRWPVMANYSFDAGNAHFVMLDANRHIDPTEPALVEWLERDLKNSKALWKFVAFHQPGFHSSKAHYDEQRMRLLAPVFERLGVDVVFNGHVHNYQRSAPLRFAPEGGIQPNGNVRGTFKIDARFDGVKNTHSDGVIYIVTGGGGASFYDAGFTDEPDLWRRPGDTWAPFTRKFVADRHTFTSVSIEGPRFHAHQLDPFGNTVDSFTIEKR